MDREYAFVEALHQPNRDPKQQEAFVKADEQEARLTARTAVRMWKNGESQLSRTALDFLRDVGELSIVPLVEGELHSNPGEIDAALEVITDAELGLRTQIAKRLDPLLDDKRPVPQKRLEAEEQPKPRRVCDVAYLAMCKLVHLGEHPWQQAVDESSFLSAPEATRDKLILQGRHSNVWKRTLDPTTDVSDGQPPPPSSRRGGGKGPARDLGM